MNGKIPGGGGYFVSLLLLMFQYIVFEFDHSIHLRDSAFQKTKHLISIICQPKFRRVPEDSLHCQFPLQPHTYSKKYTQYCLVEQKKMHILLHFLFLFHQIYGSDRSNSKGILNIFNATQIVPQQFHHVRQDKTKNQSK